jgi:hypothetical protein
MVLSFSSSVVDLNIVPTVSSTPTTQTNVLAVSASSNAPKKASVSLLDFSKPT